MLLVSEYGRTIARKAPVFLHLYNQSVAIYLNLLIVRFRTLYVLFFTFFQISRFGCFINCPHLIFFIVIEQTFFNLSWCY